MGKTIQEAIAEKIAQEAVAAGQDMACQVLDLLVDTLKLRAVPFAGTDIISMSTIEIYVDRIKEGLKEYGDQLHEVQSEES